VKSKPRRIGVRPNPSEATHHAPVGPVTGLAMAAGKAFIDEDVCAQVTAPSNSKSGRTSRISRMMSVLYNLRIIVS
jgi:hypothetical protein